MYIYFSKIFDLKNIACLKPLLLKKYQKDGKKIKKKYIRNKPLFSHIPPLKGGVKKCLTMSLYYIIILMSYIKRYNLRVLFLD